MFRVVNDETAVADGRSMLDEICREGAQAMLAVALEAEVDAYLAELVGERDADGRRLVTRNGHARQRSITTVAGAITIRAPRVDDRRVDPNSAEKAKFKSQMLVPNLLSNSGQERLAAWTGEAWFSPSGEISARHKAEAPDFNETGWEP